MAKQGLEDLGRMQAMLEHEVPSPRPDLQNAPRPPTRQLLNPFDAPLRDPRPLT